MRGKGRSVHVVLLEEGEHDDESMNIAIEGLGIVWMKAHCAKSHRTGYAVAGMDGRTVEADIDAALAWLDWKCPAEHVL
jgi:hypothetical protein